MPDDDWITAAMADHTLVAHLLLKLNKPPPLQSPQLNDVPPPVLRLDWSVKQRRSVSRKKADATRASPTTPLSWSGGTSVSCCAADGIAESKPIDTARSKVVVVSDTPITKRSRKKKTLPELKEQEGLLLKERRNLKNQLATLRLTIEKQRDANERLKRLKVDLLTRKTAQIISDAVKSEEFDTINPIKIPCDPTSPIMTINPACHKMEPSPPNSCLPKKEVGVMYPFVLPDLNLPVDENPETSILCGVS